MHPIFYQYRSASNQLDKLIQLFEENGWHFHKANPNYFHEYYWPDIVLSDKDATLPEIILSDKDSTLPEIDQINKVQRNNKYIIELLGSYDSIDEKEGRVTLYIPKIKETTHDYFLYKFPTKTYDFNAEKYFTELLSTIILIHEFVHWIIHWIKCPGFIDKNSMHRYKSMDYSNLDEVYFHESLAQLFTNFICRDSSDLYDMFDWLEKGQPNQYTAYKDLIINNNLDDTIGAVLREIEFMRQYDLQSFDVLKELLMYNIDEIDDSECLDFDEPELIDICVYRKVSNYYFQKLFELGSNKLTDKVYNKIKKNFTQP